MARELKVVLTGDERDLNRALGRVDQRLGRTGKAMHGLAGVAGTAFKAIGTAAGVGFGAAAFAAKKSVDAASDVNESLTKNQVLFGKHAKAVEQFSNRSAKAYGISKSAALEYTGVFGNLFTALGVSGDKSAKFSVSLTKLAADMASFNNTSIDDALEAIRSGLVGETEPLRRFGVNLNDATLREEAMSLGLTHTTKNVLTPYQRSMAAQALIVKQTEKAHGDFHRTASGLANQQRVLKATISDVSVAIGTALLPAAKKGTTFLAGLAGEISKIARTRNIDLGDKIKLSAAVIKRRFAPIVRDVEDEIGKADLGSKLSVAFERAAPKIADAAAAAAPRAAGAFVRAFRDAGPWGKIVTVAFLASKFGAFNAAGSWAAGKFTGALKARMAKTAPEAGAAAGAEYSTAFAATGSRGVTAAGAPGGKLGKATTRAGRVAGRAGGLAMAAGFAVAFGPALVDLIPADLKRRETELVSKIGGVLKGVFDQAIAPFRGGGSQDPIKIAQQEAANRSGDGGGGGAGLTPTTPLGRLPGSKGSPNEGASPRARSGSVRARAGSVRGTTSRVARRAAGASAPRARAAGAGIVALGRQLQSEGYSVSEHPAFGGVHPVHVNGSYHYQGLAIDVNADSFPGGEKAALDSLYARLSGRPGVIELLWQVPGHYDHLHVAVSGSSNPLGGGGGGSSGGARLGGGSGGGGASRPRRPRFTVGTVKPGSAGLGRGTAGPGYEQQVADADVTRASAEASDNLAALIGALQGELTLKRKRLKKVKRALRHGNRLSRATKQALTEERAQLIRDIAELRSLLKEYKADAAGGATTISGADALDAGASSEGAPTAADFANAAIAEASLTPDTADDIAAWNSLIGTRRDELTAARATGDPRKITDAIGNLTAALDGLAGVTQQQTAIQQALLDVMTQIKGNQERLLAVATSQPNVLLNAIISALNGGIGGRVGLGAQSPSTAGRVAAGVGRL